MSRAVGSISKVGQPMAMLYVIRCAWYDSGVLERRNIFIILWREGIFLYDVYTALKDRSLSALVVGIMASSINLPTSSLVEPHNHAPLNYSRTSLIELHGTIKKSSY